MQEENNESNPSSSSKPEKDDPNPNSSTDSTNSDDDSVLDVSGQNLEFPLLKSPKTDQNRAKDLFLYKNEFNLLPSWIAEMRKLKTLKYFANEVKLFPVEFGNLSGLECLQVKISPPGLNGFALHKLKSLKELELSKALRGPSVLPMLSEIVQLKCLTKLSVCHFSIRCLPPEIGCLNNLEYLDLSFNKMKSLPNEITYLNSLVSLKVANNKLVELPIGLSSLQQLRFLDLSNNRLTSLGSLDLASMHNLRHLNLQFNKLLSCQVPPWICCDLSGNGTEAAIDDSTNSSVEMDVYDETTIHENDRSLSYNGSCHSSSLLPGSSPSSRCYSARRSSKRWKRRHYLQWKARQERLNCSRKWKGEKYSEELVMSSSAICKSENVDSHNSKRSGGEASQFLGDEDDDCEKASLSGVIVNEGSHNNVEDDEISLNGTLTSEKHLQAVTDSSNEAGEHQRSDCASVITNDSSEQDNELLQVLKTATKPKRHCEKDLDNPKPCKSRRPVDETLDLSRKYNVISFCSFEDYLADGFYDAGRDRPFLSLGSFEQILQLDSREVILLDREKDEVLDAITLSARALIHHFKGLNASTKDGEEGASSNLQLSSLLALFVSDHFGGCDRTAIVERMRKAVSGSNYQKPFICTCSTGNRECKDSPADQILLNGEDIVFTDLCERSLRSIKASRNSIIVPIGTLKFGVCRHRALLMKYLCDRMEPPVPCEVVRGYLDYMPHAWNVVLVKKGDLWVRMVVDACRPHDIREETDPEYFSRYIPLYRGLKSIVEETTEACSSSPMSKLQEIKRAGSTSLVHCKDGSTNLVAKVRTLEVCGSSSDEIRNFEYSCLGEVRILGVLKHSCIVEMYGHRISSKWLPSEDGKSERRILESAIYMEYIRGGSLKNFMDELSKSGEKHVAADLAMFIARDVAFALSELHSKHIIHRDVKSENILIDLDEKRADGTPTVKLCDFDRAVPLRSIFHSCCIAHVGIPPPNVCVGTPRWMAPEVLQAMNQHKSYGLEVDIWSYGCLLFELLTLQIPYSDSSESVIHDLIQRGERPNLTDGMRELVKESTEDGAKTKLDGSETESETLRFLVDLFYKCTEKNPGGRPSAKEIYESTCVHASKLINNHS